ncbi:hypothetical protein DMUE_0165 [Dictyocoela muelleri]|nr:hypothetical protein DMUE_0165 [Dictyocoela muelleri]
MFENKSIFYNSCFKASEYKKPYIGVSSNLKDTLDNLVKVNLGIPNLYNSKRDKAEKWVKSIEALYDEVSEKRLYHMARESLKGEMEHWFNAYEGDTFDNLEEMLKFFKEEFIKDEESREIKLWKLLINGPNECGLVQFAYEIKSISKLVNISFNTIKERFNT